jgi:hypothetical protein
MKNLLLKSVFILLILPYNNMAQGLDNAIIENYSEKKIQFKIFNNQKEIKNNDRVKLKHINNVNVVVELPKDTPVKEGDITCKISISSGFHPHTLMQFDYLRLEYFDIAKYIRKNSISGFIIEFSLIDNKTQKSSSICFSVI